MAAVHSLRPALSQLSSSFCLVGDIGGTNARFALADLSEAAPRLESPLGLLCRDYPCLEDAADAYLAKIGAARPRAAVMAVAGPVEHGAVSFTNGGWTLSETELRRRGFTDARLINDYTAQALSVEWLAPDQLRSVGPDRDGEGDATLLVLGAGTGLGVGALARADGARTPVVTEGGHVGFAPSDLLEVEILRLLMERFGRVSAERILSGPGLTNLRWALGRIDGVEADVLTPEQIVSGARAGDDLCRRTVERFCAIYGGFAGDMALAFGARGGVYLGGGLAPTLANELTSGRFRERFEGKGRFVEYLRSIPTRIILHPHAALLGAASVARQTA